MTRALNRNTFLRFLIVGGVNTTFGYGMFAGLFAISQNKNWSLIIATMLGIVFNFFTTGRIVFNNRTFNTLIPFILSYALALLVNLMMLNVLVALNVSPLVAQASSLPVVVMVSYFINARIVFRSTCPKQSPAARAE